MLDAAGGKGLFSAGVIQGSGMCSTAYSSEQKT